MSLVFAVGPIPRRQITWWGADDMSRLRRIAGAVGAGDREPDDPNGALLKLVQRGDESAFAELYDELTALVYGTILRVVRDPAMSEEVAQEVFLELWRTAPRFDPSRGNVRTWAATISHRRAVDRVRSVDAARRRDDAEAIDLTTTPPQPEAELERTFDQERVRRGLESLTTVQRQAIELAYYKGLTYREVATALDLPEGTIKTRIRDGMIRLRDHLGVGDD